MSIIITTLHFRKAWQRFMNKQHERYLTKSLSFLLRVIKVNIVRQIIKC